MAAKTETLSKVEEV